jgi:hypothetical protein
MSVAADGTLVGMGGQAGQAQRGYDYLMGDVSDANARDGRELGFTVGGLERSRDRNLLDLSTSRTRLDQDFEKQRGQVNEDWARQLGDIRTGYQRLGQSQAGGAAMAGVAGGGTLAAALKARSANQSHDEQGLATSTERALSSLNDWHDRGIADIGTQVTRTQENYGEDDLGAIGQARRQTGYGISDRIKQGLNAGVENQAYQQDLNDQRLYQGTQAGWQAPAKGTPGGQPSNEFGTGPDAYRIVVRGTRRYRVDQSGNEKFVGTRPTKR